MIRLRDVRDGDLRTFFEQQCEPAGLRMANFRSRSWKDFLPHWKKILADGSVLKKTILSDEEVAGNVVSYDESERRLVGYWFGELFWGQGIATAALREFLHVETRRPLHAFVFHRNLGSICVLEKCGFERTDEEAGEDELYVLTH